MTAPCTRSVTITSTGTGVLRITSVAVTGPNRQDFARGDDCVGASLDPGETCQMPVRFRPTTTGRRQATLVIHQNLPWPDEGTQVALAGTGERESEPPADVKAPVVVLNSVGVDGLAGSVTEELRAAGWETRTPSSYQPKLAETTVFYPEGMEDAAATLQRAFPDIKKIEPADASMVQEALTLVIGENWPIG